MLGLHSSAPLQAIHGLATLPACTTSFRKHLSRPRFSNLSIRPQVSAAVQQLVQLAHEALQEATQSSERTARELYRAARDVLLLYRAIVPVQRQHQLESVPQLAMVFHNDCLFIAHHMRMLGLQVSVKGEMAVHAGS
jgi:hypothetical protein